MPDNSLLDRLRSAAVAVIVAHPDDEVIGAGALLAELKNAIVIHVTDGAPRDLRDARSAGFSRRDQYAEARRAELDRALECTSIGPKQRRWLGYIDQEASMHMAEMARLVAALDVDVVLTHPYEGGHPDHDATAFGVHAARALRKGQIDVIEMTSYHDHDGQTVTGEFLGADSGQTVTCTLSKTQRGQKRAMLDCFATQRTVLEWFSIDVERFRPAPAYDFTEPPHREPLHYEREWGISGVRWRELAREAVAELGLRGPL